MSIFSDLLSSDSNNSIFSHLAEQGQKWTDPIALGLRAFGQGNAANDYVNFVSGTVPRWTNMGLSKIVTPLNKVSQKVDPLQQTALGHNLGNAVSARPGDFIGMALGGYFAAPAVGGALSGSAGAGAADAGAAGGAVGDTAGALGPSAFGGSSAAGLLGPESSVTGYGAGTLAGPSAGMGASVPSLGGGGLSTYGGLGDTMAGTSMFSMPSTGGFNTDMIQQLLNQTKSGGNGGNGSTDDDAKRQAYMYQQLLQRRIAALNGGQSGF